MSTFMKFARGEMGLAKTFWVGYLGVSVVIALAGATIVTFAETGGFVIIVVALAWALFASWAVIKAAGQGSDRGLWGWLASIYVVLASGWAVYSLGKMFLF